MAPNIIVGADCPSTSKGPYECTGHSLLIRRQGAELEMRRIRNECSVGFHRTYVFVSLIVACLYVFNVFLCVSISFDLF